MNWGVYMKRVYNIFLVGLIIILSMCLIYINIYNSTNAREKPKVELDYWGQFGIDIKNGLDYTTIVDQIGLPNHIESDNYKWFNLFYDDFVICFYLEEECSSEDIYVCLEKSKLNMLYTESPQYRFGKDKVGVNSTKENIDKAYKNAVKGMLEYSYVEGNTIVNWSIGPLGVTRLELYWYEY